MLISDWSSDVCSSDLNGITRVEVLAGSIGVLGLRGFADFEFGRDDQPAREAIDAALRQLAHADAVVFDLRGNRGGSPAMVGYLASAFVARGADIFRSEEHTSELQSLMRISYAVFCLKKNNYHNSIHRT